MKAGYDFVHGLRKVESPSTSSPRRLHSTGSFRTTDSPSHASSTTSGDSRLMRADKPRFAVDSVIDSLVSNPYNAAPGSPRTPGGRVSKVASTEDWRVRQLTLAMDTLRTGPAIMSPYAAMSPAARGRKPDDNYPYHSGTPTATPAAKPARASSPRTRARAASPRASSPRVAHETPAPAAPAEYAYAMQPGPLPMYTPALAAMPTYTYDVHPQQYAQQMAYAPEPAVDYSQMQVFPGPLGASHDQLPCAVN